jgi:D-3-phosphoglycerate dehydrogenase
VRNGSAWAARSGLELTELGGKTVGIVGVGFIGSELARKLKYGFGCRVLGFDPFADPRLCRLADVEMTSTLPELLRRSQYLVLVPGARHADRSL